MLLAPADGTIAFAPNLVENRYVQPGELLFTLLPQEESGQPVAHCQLPTVSAGKFSVGSTLHLYLDAYPYKEYGILRTKVSHIAAVPQQTQEGAFLYHVTARLPDTLRTSYGITVPFKQKMTGRAVVLTEEKRILERIFEQLLDLVRNG